MVKIYYKNLRKKELKSLPEFKVGSWVHAENPTQEEIRRLSTKLDLEESLLNDALDPNEVPRMESEDGITYIFTRAPYEIEQEISTLPLLIAIGDEFILTLSPKKLSFLEQFQKNQVDFYTTQRTKLFIQLFFAINSRYNTLLTNIGRRVREARVRIRKISKKDIVQFVNFESILNDFLASLVPTKNMIQKILSGSHLKLYEEDKELVEDLFLANGQLIESCKSTLKNITNIRGAYSTIMTQDLNRIIKLLTSLTILLTIPTIIASIYGMNVPLPFQESPLAFVGIMGVTVLISAILLFVFIKNEWI